jgi:hypothetical protein
VRSGERGFEEEIVVESKGFGSADEYSKSNASSRAQFCTSTSMSTFDNSDLCRAPPYMSVHFPF